MRPGRWPSGEMRHTLLVGGIPFRAGGMRPVRAGSRAIRSAEAGPRRSGGGRRWPRLSRPSALQRLRRRHRPYPTADRRRCEPVRRCAANHSLPRAPRAGLPRRGSPKNRTSAREPSRVPTRYATSATTRVGTMSGPGCCGSRFKLAAAHLAYSPRRPRSAATSPEDSTGFVARATSSRRRIRPGRRVITGPSKHSVDRLQTIPSGQGPE